MAIINGAITMSASSTVSATMATTRLSIVDSSRPTVTAENYVTGMFDWVVEPAGSGSHRAISLL